MSADTQSAHRIAARFDVLGVLGQGGMGVVYQAYDRVHQIRVALKTIRRMSGDSLYRFKREFRALCDISHPNVVTLYELIADGAHWLLSMELIDGAHLLDHVRRDTAVEPADELVATRTIISADESALAPTMSATTVTERAAWPVAGERPALPASGVVDLERLYSCIRRSPAHCRTRAARAMRCSSPSCRPRSLGRRAPWSRAWMRV